MNTQTNTIQINPKQPQDKHSPPDVSINTIAEWMRHYPDWQMALIKRCNELEDCDLWALKQRALSIVDSDRYSQDTRNRVECAYTQGNDVAELKAAVLEAERERKRTKKRTRAEVIPAISNPDNGKGVAHA